MERPQRLARVFVELADTLVEEFDVVDFLQMITERCVEVLAADAAGLMLADQRGNLRLVASTLERAQLLELLELQIEEGPCVECFATGRPIVNVDLPEARDRWPRFAAAAVDAGFRSTHALPMRLRNQVIGALNLFTDEQSGLSNEDVAIGQAMADVATIGLLHERTLREQTALSEQLQTALQSRILIEQAKGVLAARAAISVTEAFTQMRNHARRNHVTLTAVAAAIIEGTLDETILASS
jgi:transcriptional regulator with GAF, ATPase, and Fis domain